MTVDNFDWAGL